MPAALGILLAAERLLVLLEVGMRDVIGMLAWAVRGLLPVVRYSGEGVAVSGTTEITWEVG